MQRKYLFAPLAKDLGGRVVGFERSENMQRSLNLRVHLPSDTRSLLAGRASGLCIFSSIFCS